MYKAVIFDLDGTLLDTLDDITSCLNQALVEHGLTGYLKDQVRTMVGYGLEQLIRQAVPSSEAPKAPAVLASMKGLYLGGLATQTQPYPGISRLVSDLHGRGCQLAVHTNKLHSLSLALVEQFFPGQFAAVQGDQPGVAKKPAPDGTRLLLQGLNLQPDEAVFVGDSEADVQTAHNAGVAFLAVTWGFRSRAELAAAGATRFCDDTAALRTALGLD